MFERDNIQNNLGYRSSNGTYYSLLLGMTDNLFSSDIVFIFMEPHDNGNGYFVDGKVIGYTYGGFEDTEYIEKVIKEYEENKERGK